MTSFFFLSHKCPVLFWVLISATVWTECVIIFVFLKESPGLKTDDGNMTACRHQLGAAPPLSDVLKCVFSCNGQCCSSGKQITPHTYAKWVYKEICWHRGLRSISVFLEERVSEEENVTNPKIFTTSDTSSEEIKVNRMSSLSSPERLTRIHVHAFHQHPHHTVRRLKHPRLC